jgi:hypothetical protein
MKISELMLKLKLYNPDTDIVLVHNVGDAALVRLSAIANIIPVELKDKDNNTHTFISIVDETTRADKPASQEQDNKSQDIK